MPRDLVIRDNLADSGAVPVGHPFWDSPDIWVRNASPAVDGAAALPASYGTAGPHLAPIASQNNWVYVRLKNFGGSASWDYHVRVYLAHWPGTEFTFPNSFIPTNRPGQPVPNPLTPGTYLLGEVKGTALGSMTDTIINVPWPMALVPPPSVMVGGSPVTWHPCLLAQVSPHDGPPPSGNHVWDDNNLAQKNITIDYDTSVGGDSSLFRAAVVIGHAENFSKQLHLVFDRSRLPASIRLFVEVLDPAVMEALRGGAGNQPAAEGKGEPCGLLFPEGGRVVLRHCDGRRVTLHLKPGSSLELECADRRSGMDQPYEFGSYDGREVLWLAPVGRTRIPVPYTAAAHKLVVIGGVVGAATPLGTYEFSLTQYDDDGTPSGGLGMEVHVGKK